MATQEVRLPKYVEYGGRVTAPGDFECLDGHFRTFVLKGSEQKIKNVVDCVFNKPAGGEYFRALTSHVLLQIGWFGSVRALTRPFDEWGTVRETMCSIWVPLAQGRVENGTFKAHRLVMSVPFIWVDNPMSYAGGRETYGYPKSMGQFTFANGVKDTMAVRTYGGDHGYKNQAEWCDVIKVDPQFGPGERESSGEPLNGTEEWVDHISDHRTDPRARWRWPGIQFIGGALEEARAGRSTQLFLKQFRDAEDPDGACYQDLIEAPIQITTQKPHFHVNRWQVDITEIGSHPITRDLGVESQATMKSYAMDLEFICKRGKRVVLEP